LTSFGSQLRETREARGLSLEAVADATRIAPRHLSALEQSDVEALPPGPFAKGYIEAYSRLLGIDPEPIVEACRSQGRQHGLGTPEAQDRIIEELSQIVEQRAGPPRRPGVFPAGWKWLALVLVVVGLLGGGGWLLSRARTPRPAVAPSPLREEPAVAVGPEVVARDAPGSAEVGAQASPDPGSPPLAPPAREPAPPAAARPAETAVSSVPSDLEVSHSGVGTGVENNRLVGRADRFTEGGPVVFWTRVLGGRPGDVIHHVWFHEGQRVTLAELTLGGSHWRTHSRRFLDPGLTGRWVVEARRPDGEVLARQEFLCVPAEEP